MEISAIVIRKVGKCKYSISSWCSYFLLSYYIETEDGINVCQFVIDNYPKYKEFLPKIDFNDPDLILKTKFSILNKKSCMFLWHFLLKLLDNYKSALT